MSQVNPKSCINPQQESVEQIVNAARQGRLERRGFLRRAVALGISSAAAYKLLSETQAAAQNGAPKITTFAVGEEGDPPATTRPSPNPPTTQPGQPTTLAVGEESPSPRPAPVPTTKAVGEETQTARPTTFAIGEEQPYCPNPQVTTRAVGEESTPKPSPTTLRVGEESNLTTRALGEESTPTTRPPATTGAWGEEATTPPPSPTRKPNATTMALGEENNSRTRQGIPNDFLKNLAVPWKNFRRW